MDEWLLIGAICRSHCWWQTVSSSSSSSSSNRVTVASSHITRCLRIHLPRKRCGYFGYKGANKFVIRTNRSSFYFT